MTRLAFRLYWKTFFILSTFLFSVIAVHAQSPVVVGTRLSDSSGTVSISSFQLQQAVFPLVESLKTGYSITGAISIKVGQTSYLLFDAAGPGSDTAVVAIELLLTGSNFYLNAGPKGYGVHTCKKKGSCSSCIFFYNHVNKIVGCSCAAVLQSQDWNCQHRFENVKNN